MGGEGYRPALHYHIANIRTCVQYNPHTSYTRTNVAGWCSAERHGRTRIHCIHTTTEGGTVLTRCENVFLAPNDMPQSLCCICAACAFILLGSVAENHTKYLVYASSNEQDVRPHALNPRS